ncbi:phosphotransferase family protein [Streptomyces sp. NBC_01530]|uniref:phosphotransferase family protein n=1 Tax=Streptomyces sp. NBC_01530 TaxID=2903895 RepID=UPI0038672AA9
MGITERPGRLLGSGRDADVYEIDEAWVLRRSRQGWGDAAAKGAVMEHVRAHGYPVPRVRLADCTRTDLVMERLSGPTMLQALSAGAPSGSGEDRCDSGAPPRGAGLYHRAAPLQGETSHDGAADDRRRVPPHPAERLGVEEAGAMFAGLLRRLHSVPARHSAGRVLHLDLHPDNVMLTPDGPRVIDWTNAEEGDPGLDWGMSAMILAQVAVGGESLAEPARAILAALLADPSQLTDESLAEARRRRAANPTMSRREIELLGDAEELIRSFLA